MIIAGIGTREPTPTQRDNAIKLARYLVANGHTIKTGGAGGIDQAFMDGGSEVDPTKVIVCLPWDSYQVERLHPGNKVVVFSRLAPADQARLMLEAGRHHPAWDRCGQGARKLHARNGLILDGCQVVLACPSNKPGGGGTGQGMRLSKDRGARLVDFAHMQNPELSALCQELRQRNV